MLTKESDYDFLCNNDTRQIKLTIQGDAFFAATIQSETAKKIDLSGGTKNVGEITLAYCLKLTRIIWPEDTGAIKRLAIHSAEALASLDLSSLINLEELSIFNCPELESVTGLGKSVKLINLHGVNLKSLDVSQAKNLEKLNVLTIFPTFSMTVKQGDALQILLLQGNQIKLNLQQCPTLVSLLINNSQPVIVDITACPNITDACIVANENSVITGLGECRKAQLHETTSKKTAELKKLTTDFIEPIIQHKPGPEDMETVIQKYGTIRERNHACIIMISLLSSMEKSLTLELEKVELPNKSVTQETRSFDDYPELIIFLPETNINIPEKKLSPDKRFPNKEAEIIHWLKNANKQQENLLLLNKRDIKNAEIFNLLKQLEHHRQLLTFMGVQYNIQYKLPLTNKIIVDFPRRLLTRTAIHLFDSVPGASAVPSFIAASTSDAIQQRMMSEILRLLDDRRAMQKEMLRKFSNSLSRKIAARNRYNRMTVILRQERLARIAAHPESMAQDLPVQRKGQPIEAPPKLWNETENHAFKETKVNVGSERQNLHHERLGIYKSKFGMDGTPISQEPTLLATPDEESSLLNLEQANKINIEPGINPGSTAKEKTEAKKMAAAPSVIDASEQLSALEDLLFDTEYFANILSSMTKEAKTRAKPDDLVMQSAILIIEKSISTSLSNLSFAKSTQDMSAKSDILLYVDQELNTALKKLNETCQTSFKHKQSVSQSEREQLIDSLTNISQKFLEAHQVNDQSRGVFGTGLRAGQNAIRMNLLKNWIEVLKNNRPLPSSGFNATLTELFKDKELRATLQPEVELLRKYLISSPEPTKRRQ